MIELNAALRVRDNDYSATVKTWESRTGYGWHTTATTHPPDPGSFVSVVIPAHNVAYALPFVFGALGDQHHRRFEVVVVDDASADDTASIAAAHPVVDTVVRLPTRHGAATARNLGTLLATGETVVYLDADMVLPAHVIGDLAARARTGAVLVGFRHNLAHDTYAHRTAGPTAHRELWHEHHPDLRADHRVVWRPPVGRPLLYSGITLSEPVNGRPLKHTREFRDLGHGRRYHDWDLPRMVVTALLAAPREAVMDIGGFDPEFGRLGWGMEDTYLGACLIAAGSLVIPLRQAVGFHLDPPDAPTQWQRKLATWPDTLARYWALMRRPAPSGRADRFTAAAIAQLRSCEVLR